MRPRLLWWLEPAAAAVDVELDDALADELDGVEELDAPEEDG